MNKTSTILLTVIIAALIVGAGVYIYMDMNASPSNEISPSNEVSPEETMPLTESTSKSTYQNDKYGFSFEYNSEKYNIEESKSRDGATGDESDLIRMTAKGETCPAVDIFVSTATLEQELNDLEFRISGDTTETTINGITATKKSGEITENIPPCGSEKTEIVFEHNGNVFVISAFKDRESSLNELLESIEF